MTSNGPKQATDRAMKAAAGSGFEFAASVAAFAVGGYFLDRWQGTSPMWTLIGTAIGFIGGGYNLYKATRGITRAGQRDRRRDARQRVEAREAASSGTPEPTGHSGAVHEHVPAFEDSPRRARTDFGMFGRTEATDEDMVAEDEIRWPEGMPADDTPRLPADEAEENDRDR